MEFLCCFFFTLDSSKAASCSHDAKTVFATVVPTDSQQGNAQRVKVERFLHFCFNVDISSIKSKYKSIDWFCKFEICGYTWLILQNYITLCPIMHSVLLFTCAVCFYNGACSDLSRYDWTKRVKRVKLKQQTLLINCCNTGQDWTTVYLINIALLQSTQISLTPTFCCLFWTSKELD